MMSDLQSKVKSIGPYISKLPNSESVCLVILKNTNDHALIFRAAKYGLEPSWLLADSEGYHEQNASLLDKTMMNMSVQDDGTLQFPFNLQKTCKLAFDSKSQPVLISEIEGICSTVDVVYVDIVPTNMQQTNLCILGKSLDSGKQLHEIVSVDLSWVPVTLLL